MNAPRAYAAGATLLFAACAAATIGCCASMSAMHGMAMPGGWTMSMAWMRMPGQSWPGAAATFIGMWLVMMIAMMLPAVAPTLARYQRALRTADAAGAARAGALALLAGAGYFLVWTLLGLAAFPLGALLSGLEMQRPAIAQLAPAAAGLVVLSAGALQFTAWKQRQLDLCCAAAARGQATAAGALRYGLRLGRRCGGCCAGLTAVLLTMGVMDLRAMAAVTAAIALERLAPANRLAARWIGAALCATGVLLLAAAG